MKRIILSRTDSIGDVVLTLPMAGVLKEHFPTCTIIFLGKSYTRPVIEACRYVDEFVDVDEAIGNRDKALGKRDEALGNRDEALGKRDEAIGKRDEALGKRDEALGKRDEGPEVLQTVTLRDFLRGLHADIIFHVFPKKEICKAAKEARIPMRIATSHRWYAWLYCNKLLHFTRKKSALHEAQLNLKMLEAVGLKRAWSIDEIAGYYGLIPSPIVPAPARVEGHFTPENERKLLILHPKSKGSAREWGLENFGRLIELLPPEEYTITITGTAEEGKLMQEFLIKYQSRVVDMTGKLTLSELIAFIGGCDALVAASTGPLHIAAALGRKAIGLYAPMQPIHPGRWAPVGVDAHYLVLDKTCNACRKSGDCACIRSIRPEEVVALLGSEVAR